jgi:hypothetical protein
MIDMNDFFELGPGEGRLLEGRGVLLCGAAQSGKSSLAFQCALNHATGRGGGGAEPGQRRAVIIGHRSNLDSKAPKLQTPLEELDEEVLACIEFRYVTNLRGVRQCCAELGAGHSAGGARSTPAEGEGEGGSPVLLSGGEGSLPIPTLIVLDDEGLEEVAGGPFGLQGDQRTAYCKTIAVLDHTVRYLGQCRQQLGLEQDEGGQQLGPYYTVVSNIATGMVETLPFGAVPVVGTTYPSSGPGHFTVHFKGLQGQGGGGLVPPALQRLPSSLFYPHTKEAGAGPGQQLGPTLGHPALLRAALPTVMDYAHPEYLWRQQQQQAAPGPGAGAGAQGGQAATWVYGYAIGADRTVLTMIP